MSSEKSREHHDGSSGRAFTVDQKAAVVRVRKCSPTAFYDILGLEATKSTATESDIKKAYRKLSLLTHPDKNGYNGADEAFKMVARAFAVLSDADKKAKFDRFGGDPDSRFQGASASSASPFSGGGATRRGQGGGMFDDEISPEDLFRQFFGGGGMGMGGGGFGGGPFGMSYLHSFSASQSFRLTQHNRRWSLRRPRLRLQHGRRPRRPCTPIRRRRTTTTTPTSSTRPQCTTALLVTNTTIPATSVAPLHLPLTLWSLLRLQHTLRPLRQARPNPAIHPTTRLLRLWHSLLRGPARSLGYLNAEVERAG